MGLLKTQFHFELETNLTQTKKKKTAKMSLHVELGKLTKPILSRL